MSQFPWPEAVVRWPIGTSQTQLSGRVLVNTARRLEKAISLACDDAVRFEDRDQRVRAMEELVCRLDDRGDITSACMSRIPLAVIERHQRIYSDWQEELERRFVATIEKTKDVDRYHLARQVRKLVQREVEMMDTSRIRRVQFIGSGALPLSAIRIQAVLGVDVDCVEIDAEAVRQSRKVLDILGLSRKVNVIEADGAAIDAGPYDAVIVAVLAKPKREITAAIGRSARSDCQVMCRTTEGLRILFYEPMRCEHDLPMHTERARRSPTGPDDIVTAVLLAPSVSQAAIS